MHTAAGSTTLTGPDFWEFYAPSVITSATGIIPEKNRSLTITQSLMVSEFLLALQKEEFSPLAGTKIAEMQAPGAVNKYEKGTQPYLAMPRNDQSGAGRLSLSLLDQMLQQLLLSDIEFGNQGQELSGLAIQTLLTSKNMLILPILLTRSLFRRKLYTMFAKQIEIMKLDIELPSGTQKVKINASIFEGNYVIMPEFNFMDPRQSMVDVGVAASLGDLVSDDYKRETILKLESPEEEKHRLTRQQAELTNPILAQYNVCMAYADEGNRAKAQAAKAQLEQMILAQQAPQEAEQPQGAQGPQPIVPLIGTGGGGRGSASPIPNARTELTRGEGA